jgi:hypothetical protein
MQHFKLYGLGDTNSSCDPAAAAGAWYDPVSLVAQAQCTFSSTDTTSFDNCSTQADSDQNYAAIQSQLATVDAWTPTSEYFTASDAQAIVTQQANLVSQALSYLQNVITACGTAPGCQSGGLLSQMQANLTANSNDATNVMTRAQTISTAIANSQSSLSAALPGSTAYVQISGFKSWIQDSLLAIAQAIHASLVVECQMPGWSSAIGAVVSAFQAFANFAMQLVGIAENVINLAVTAGKAILTTANAGIGFIGWITQYWWLTLLAVGAGFFVWYKRGWIVDKIFRRKPAPAMAGLRGFLPAAKYEVDGRPFDDKRRAQAMAKLLSSQYGHIVRVQRVG